MANNKVNLIEKCQVGPPQGSVPSPTSIPLSSFDLPWLLNPVSCKRICFYEFPYSKTHFLQKVVPNLKQSLSFTLKHFFPFSSNIVFPPKPQTPHILYLEGDTLTFTVVESTTTNLNNLLSHTPRDVTCLDPFIPILPSPHVLEDGTLFITPMVIQVTLLPNSGFTICITFNHVVSDGRSLHNFIKFWASLCMSKKDLSSFPFLDRDKIGNSNELKSIFLEELWNMPLNRIGHMNFVPNNNVANDMVKHTIVLRRDQIENLKKLVSIKCQSLGLGTLLHVSTFVVTCSLIWVSNIKLECTQTSDEFPNEDEELYMMVLADCRYFSEMKIPLTYFGNCLVSGLATMKRSKLVGQNGLFEAAIAIGSKVRELQCDPYKGVETLMSLFRNVVRIRQRLLAIAGSPKLGAYESDFGWGKPKLSEVGHVNSPGVFSLSDCRDIEGGIEVGIALEKSHMHKFNIILNELLANLVLHQD
ncbi:coumaroyl-CoA:anthocyanidin 3-O-glucoside-6''-O-coumaroyltransferase 1-like [Arachis duranensis]|uniref:Coumaroyl-CoA:anthocyanidin 3-O-glucoside-6''-O-coumaroyltransferase 1-like n=1 Tax=Arachis duranensis TaxID=130453 RepID=A0A6P4D564_ARADU|nr:coumaroyl-CoA:anthocyanidin 3-O-glucoside-6''-O-coumaroyltransferase 1-like [Arachis duranensis]